MEQEIFFRCPKRPINDRAAKDYWQKKPNGDLFCSNCYSMHPQGFLAFCKRVTSESKNEVRIEDENGAVWLVRPEITSYKQGAVKFYPEHLEHWMNGFGNDEKIICRKFIKDAERASLMKQKKTL